MTSWNHRHLDFCLHDVSSALANCCISIFLLQQFVLLRLSLYPSFVASSRTKVSFKALLVRVETLLKTSLFHVIKSLFKDLNF